MGSETYKRTGNTNAFLTHPAGAGPELFKLNQEQWYNVYVVYILLYAATAPAAKSLQSCQTLCDPIDGSPPGSPIPGILQTRTRVGCHFLLQCMKVKTESEVAQSCPILSDPVDCSLPGSSIHGIFQARVLEWVAIAFSDSIVYILCIFLSLRKMIKREMVWGKIGKVVAEAIFHSFQNTTNLMKQA